MRKEKETTSLTLWSCAVHVFFIYLLDELKQGVSLPQDIVQVSEWLACVESTWAPYKRSFTTFHDLDSLMSQLNSCLGIFRAAARYGRSIFFATLLAALSEDCLVFCFRVCACSCCVFCLPVSLSVFKFASLFGRKTLWRGKLGARSKKGPV